MGPGGESSGHLAITNLPCDSCVLWGDVPSLSACQRGQGSSDAPGDPFQSSGQRGLLTVAAPRAPPGSRTPQLLHPSANRPWPWPGHTLPGKSTQLCSLCSLEPLPLQGTQGDGETQAPLHFQVAPFTYFSWLSRGLSPLPRLPVLLGEGVQRWGAAGSRFGARPSRQSLSLKLSTQLSPNASGQGGGLSSHHTGGPVTTPHSTTPHPLWGVVGRMTGAPRGQSGPGAGCEGRGSQSQGASENSKTTCDSHTRSKPFPPDRAALAEEPEGCSWEPASAPPTGPPRLTLSARRLQGQGCF